MTHFPGLPSLIFQGQGEWEQAGSHVAGRVKIQPSEEQRRISFHAAFHVYLLISEQLSNTHTQKKYAHLPTRPGSF